MISTASSSISSRIVGARPGVAEDVLVERLAAADPEAEAAPGMSVAVVAAAWAMIAGWMRTVGQVTAVVPRQLRSPAAMRAEHGPHERALALLVVPRVEVVGDPAGRGSRPASALRGRVDELGSRALLARERDSDERHVNRLPFSASR